MDVAIVTGASGGLGLAIARRLVEAGCRVYGLGGDYRDLKYGHDDFIPRGCDLSDIDSVRAAAEEILEREGNIYALVNNAKLLPAKSLEALTPEEIERIVRINLICPLVLTRLALPTLQRFQGCVVNIASTNNSSSRGGATGALCDGALHRFGVALFEEVRDHGVRVTTLFPQTNRLSAQTQGDASRKPAPIDLDGISQAVVEIVNARSGNVITEMVVRPQTTHKVEAPEVIELPYTDDAKPHSEEELAEERERVRIETEERERAYAEKRREQSRRDRERNRQQREEADDEDAEELETEASDKGVESDETPTNESERERPRRRGRRGGRGRRREAEGGEEERVREPRERSSDLKPRPRPKRSVSASETTSDLKPRRRPKPESESPSEEKPTADLKPKRAPKKKAPAKKKTVAKKAAKKKRAKKTAAKKQNSETDAAS